MKRTVLIALCACILAFGGLLAAGAQATLILRSGERVTGDLVDMGADFTIMVNGQERRIAISDVTVIDFVGAGQGLPQTELSAVTGEHHVTVLRGGTSFRGRLIDITGTAPLKLIFSIDGGQREVSSAEVGRVYLARPDAAVATSGTSATAGVEGGGTIAVPANAQWVDTGIVVRKGDLVSFQASGEITLSNDANDIASPAGSKSQRFARKSPIPRALTGALIGRVGRSEPFGIGDQTNAISMPASGRLMLRINDDNLRDNSGQFTVVINR